MTPPRFNPGGSPASTGDSTPDDTDSDDGSNFDDATDLKPKQILFSSKPGAEGAGKWSRSLDRVVEEYRRRSDATTRYPEARRWST